MVQANLPGRAAHKIKTIDVEANLLAERIAERERLLDALSKRALAGMLVLACAALALPVSYRLQAQAATKAEKATMAAALVEKRLAEKQAALTTAQPIMAETQMLDAVRSYARNLTTQLGVFLNSAGQGMVFSNVKVDILGGDMRVSGKADAESYSVARDYVSKLAKLPKVKRVTLKKWRQNTEFAPAGVAFEVEHTAEVGK